MTLRSWIIISHYLCDKACIDSLLNVNCVYPSLTPPGFLKSSHMHINDHRNGVRFDILEFRARQSQLIMYFNSRIVDSSGVVLFG